MTRVPLQEIDGKDPATEAAHRSFVRENRAPIDLYRALANAPALLVAFHEMGDALRYRARTPRRLRELAVLRTAYLTRSEYEWQHHVGMAAAAGVGEREMQDVVRWTGSDAFDPPARAALRIADEMHVGEVTDEAFAALVAATSVEEATELVVCCAHYQGVARVVQALGVTTEPDYARSTGLPPPGASQPGGT